jgi:hypothetical protein
VSLQPRWLLLATVLAVVVGVSIALWFYAAVGG